MKTRLACVALVLAVSTPAAAGPWAIDRPASASVVEGEAPYTEPVRSPAPRPGNVWKPIFAVSLGLAITSTVFTYYARTRQQDEAKQIQATSPNGFGQLTDDDCGTEVVDDVGGHFASACSWNRRGTVGLLGAVGFGTFTVVAAYFAFRTQPSDRLIAVTPTVTRETAGAQLSLAW
ncbi:MAG: hypothetical protein ABI175_27305 [Polyangiales bacterium]